MGIHGIYKEIGPGTRIALSKLAVEKFEKTGRPFRIAIDVSIWLFQIQASKGGTNPALRTFYYRLLRLISLSIHPIFVFDGPNKPPFKRNKRTGPNVASIPEFLAKQLLKQFGFPIHLAPGEAEAECALLQRQGIVDAVLSEDVDTLMFGSGVTIRNWSPEQKTGKTPTHVNVYDAVETKNGPAGLDREGMILIALMSGGDYVPEGIPGCGPKTACEAARAGFGSDLCKIAKNDAKGLKDWRDRLRHELNTNESKLFSRKKPSLKIPDDFPRRDILGYYTHPAISSDAGLKKLKDSINWDQELDFPGLRDFAHDAFDWVRLEGAKHFIRSLAPSLLVRHLRMRGEHTERFPTDNIDAIEEDEALLVKGIHGKRQHAVTDGTTELRVSFSPIHLVKIDLDKEEPDEDLDALRQGSEGPDADIDDEIPLELDDEEGPKKRGPTKFDPYKPARVWVLETYVKVGVPLKVQDWEGGRQKPQRTKRTASASDASRTAPKTRGTRTAKAGGSAPQATIERFAKVTKPGTRLSRALAKAQSEAVSPPKKAFVDLLSSSPARPPKNVQSRTREEPLSPPPEDLPSSVTKRRRGPMQRSHTLPSDLAAASRRPSTPPPELVDTLDLVDSPIRPSPTHLPARKSKTQVSRSGTIARAQSVNVSPRKTKQSTLDAWRRRDEPGPLKQAPAFEISEEGMDRLDLTLSSPAACSQPTANNPRKAVADVFAPRPPLGSISSNTPQNSTSSTSRSSSTNSTRIQKTRRKPSPPSTTHRRTSPRLARRTKSTSPKIDSLDLTSLSPPPIQHPPITRATRSPPPEIDSLDLTACSSPPRAIRNQASHPPITVPSTVPPSPPKTSQHQQQQPAKTPLPRRSPRLTLSLSPTPSPSPPHNTHDTRTSNNNKRPTSPAPPAAWKSQARKKRAVVLRKSLLGAWTFEDVSSPVQQQQEEGKDKEKVGGAGCRGDARARRKWRESEIEVLDLS